MPQKLIYHESNDVIRVDQNNLDESVCEATRRECERIRRVTRGIVNKYLRMLNNTYLSERIAEMINRGDHSVTLMWDKITNDDRFLDRKHMITRSFREVAEFVNQTDYPHITNWDSNIRETLWSLLPQGYRVYAHYDYEFDTSHIIGYEITIYWGNRIWYDPWCQLFCRWRYLERDADYCQFPKGRL
jgi:hypothetical protein